MFQSSIANCIFHKYNVKIFQILTHFGLAIWRHIDIGKHYLREWLVACGASHYPSQCCPINVGSMGTHQRPMWQEVISICKMSLKTTSFKLLRHISGASELNLIYSKQESKTYVCLCVHYRKPGYMNVYIYISHIIIQHQFCNWRLSYLYLLLEVWRIMIPFFT